MSASLRERLLGTAYFVIGHREDAREAVQDAFVKCWRNRNKAAEVRDLGPAPGDAPAGGVRLLHHPIEGAAPRRYLELLEARTGGRCLAATGVGALPGDPSQPLLPLALASNRLTEQLAEYGSALRAEPLLKRPRCRQALLESLVGVP